MKKTYIVLIFVLVLVVIVFSLGKNNKSEAPTISNDVTNNNEESGDISPVTNSMPVPGSNSVPETQVFNVQEFNISGNNFAYSPNVINVKKGDRVKINFTDTGGYHNLVVEGYGVTTKTAQAPFTDTIEFTADKAGTFQYYCSVGTHRAQGMFGTLNVQ